MLDRVRICSGAIQYAARRTSRKTRNKKTKHKYVGQAKAKHP